MKLLKINLLLPASKPQCYVIQSSPYYGRQFSTKQYLGRDNYNPRRSNPNIIVGSVILTCSGVYLWHTIEERKVLQKSPPSGSQTNARGRVDWLDRNLTFSKRNLQERRWWTLMTHTITHYTWWHLGVNMIAVWGLGRTVVALFGVRTFAMVWVVAGAGGALLDLYWKDITMILRNQKIPEKPNGGYRDQLLLGSSGSISGLLGLAACALPRIYGTSAIGFAAFSIACAQTNLFPSIGHIDHVGSMGIGAAWWLMVMRRRKS